MLILVLVPWSLTLTRVLFWYLYLKLQNSDGYKYSNNTGVSAWTVHHASAYMFLFLQWHYIHKPLSCVKNGGLHTLIFVPLAKITFWWWGHNRSRHDDVIKWKYFSCYWSFVRGIHRSPVNSSHKGQWRGALMFSLICVWINGWVNNHKAMWISSISYRIPPAR